MRIIIPIMHHIGIYVLRGLCLSLLLFSHGLYAADEILLGPDYQGPKCAIAVGDFTVRVLGAPLEIGDGLREMLQTALFESNHFIVMDRSDPAGISAEKLLSESFLSNPDAILQQRQMQPAEILVYGAITTLEGKGFGLRLKVPGAPIKLGGAYHKANIAIDLHLVDSASGKLIATQSVKGTALSGRGMLGSGGRGTLLPLKLEMFQNTPLELAIRDCIYRAVIRLRKVTPPYLFQNQEP